MKKLLLVLTAIALLLLAACAPEPQIGDSSSSISEAQAESAADSDPDSITASLAEIAVSVLGEDVQEAWLGAIGEDGIAPDMTSILRAVAESGQKLSLDELKEGILEILESGDFDTVDISSAVSQTDLVDALGAMVKDAWKELTGSIKITDLTKLLKLLK